MKSLIASLVIAVATLSAGIVGFAEEEQLPLEYVPGIIAIQESDGWTILCKDYYQGSELSYKEGNMYKSIDMSKGYYKIPKTEHITLRSEAESGASIEFTTFDTTLNIPGKDGFTYKKGEEARMSLTTEKSGITQGTDVYDNSYLLQSITEPNKHIIKVYQNITIGIAVADKNGMGCGKMAEISCFDGDPPRIAWSKAGEYKDLVEGTESLVNIEATDDDTEIKTVEAKEGSGKILVLEEPFVLHVKNNGQWLITAIDKAGNKASTTVDVNWYKTTSSLPDTDLPIKPPEVDGDVDDKDENKDKDNSGTTVVSGNKKKTQSNSTWDKYWKEQTKSATPEPKPNTDKSKQPVAPSGYKYVYREKEESVSKEQINLEINDIVEEMESNGEEVTEEVVESIAVTSEVTLVKEEKEKNEIQWTKIAGFVGAIVLIGVVGIVGKKIYF